MLRLIDTHAHLDEIEDPGARIAEAREAGVMAVIAVGCDLPSNRQILKLSAIYKEVYPALGWHPDRIREEEMDAHLEFIAANMGKAVALGEVGLDYHKRVRAVADKDLQKRVLEDLLKIAAAHDKPVSLHSRYAWRDAYDAVERAGLAKVVFHWYTGTSSVLRDIVGNRHYISATPAVEYHDEHRRAVREAPLDRLLLETDSPVTYGRGGPGEFVAAPADVRRSLKGAAELRGMGEEELAAATTTNAIRLFGIG